MNILVLGNGFDLAHGLKTSYTNFLDAVEITADLMEYEKEIRTEIWIGYDKTKIPQSLCSELEKIVKKRSHATEDLKKFYEHMRENFWFNYFRDKSEGTWIDFERDIKEVCLSIESSIWNKGTIRKLNEKINIDRDFGSYAKYLNNKEEVDDFSKLINFLEKDLKNVMISLDMYINNFIKKEECDRISPDVISLDIDKVISFNYSMTYQNFYNIAPNIECDYIHGKAGRWGNNEYGNLVLGYDEMNERINEDIISILIPFKKYYQRVLIGTDREYVKWIKDIKDDKDKKHFIYFFGHSMDITDKDVIKELILNSNVKTTIYFYSKQDKIGKLKNLVSVLGYENFIEYTKNGSVEFVNQQTFEKKEYLHQYTSKLAVKNLCNIPYISDIEYKSINEWFEKLKSTYHAKYAYDIKYFYLAIDALQKYKIEDEKVEKLIKICNEHAGNICSYNEFLITYYRYWGREIEFNNNELEKLINSIYEKRVENKKKEFYRFLERIDVHTNTINSIYMETTYLNIDSKKLDNIGRKFLNHFDEDYVYFDKDNPNLDFYYDMVKFLCLVKPYLVKELFSSMLNDSSLVNVKRNRIKILQQEYNKYIEINGREQELQSPTTHIS
ncbi:AbiH family protein [Clostridium intestinale]|uniref:Bacteriophage abortive infection AbiH family protein n=1 Tax=Clostridium intestinale TaxID=36845 RepID=A0A7D7A211_9CLOT|nr:AbiH family protein [Clostridium intestinale]QLY81235.1 hypothetical protein HZF06_06510 [Clostridium intestinale]